MNDLIKKIVQMRLVKRHWAILIIIAAWFIFSSPYFLKGLIPFPSKYLVTFFAPWSAEYGMPLKNNAMPDVITQIYPWKRLTIDTWKTGHVPLWNPYSFSGTIHAANYQTAVFSPFNLLFLLLPMIDAWSVLVLLQPLLAGLFMYGFLRSLDRSSEASLVGSVAFMFCGFIVVWMAYATLGFAALWLPVTLFAIHSGFKKYSWWTLCLLTLGLALSFFSGHFQISLYVAGLTLVYLLWETVRTKQWARGGQLFAFYILGILLVTP
ncbi:YfhO family protein, partial [Candidatus Gottesmanbacteria bacterium]|nr:YfhO family protein [Candidatus Gottesmanbacteria bacterium]